MNNKRPKPNPAPKPAKEAKLSRIQPPADLSPLEW
jgi:hypothetical protein